jgi:serine/threonine protein kinase
LFTDLCLGANYLHLKNILHHDLHPGNCLLFPGWVLKIADFGMSRELGKPPPSSPPPSLSFFLH